MMQLHRESHHMHYHFRSSHDHYLSQPFARTNPYFYSFVSHTVSLWNSLPTEILSLSSLNSFKLHVRDYLGILLFSMFTLLL